MMPDPPGPDPLDMHLPPSQIPVDPEPYDPQFEAELADPPLYPSHGLAATTDLATLATTDPVAHEAIRTAHFRRAFSAILDDLFYATRAYGLAEKEAAEKFSRWRLSEPNMLEAVDARADDLHPLFQRVSIVSAFSGLLATFDLKGADRDRLFDLFSESIWPSGGASGRGRSGADGGAEGGGHGGRRGSGGGAGGSGDGGDSAAIAAALEKLEKGIAGLAAGVGGGEGAGKRGRGRPARPGSGSPSSSSSR